MCTCSINYYSNIFWCTDLCVVNMSSQLSHIRVQTGTQFDRLLCVDFNKVKLCTIQKAMANYLKYKCLEKKETCHWFGYPNKHSIRYVDDSDFFNLWTSCSQGDSGGPFMCERDGRWYQAGIVSAGYECGNQETPSLYTRISHYRKWITDTMELHSD